MLRPITALVVAMFALASLTSPLYAQATKEPAKKDAAASKKAPLDLNTVSEAELKAYPGVGEAYSSVTLEGRRIPRQCGQRLT